MEPDAFDIKYGNQLWMSVPIYVKFLKECLSRGMYHLIFLSDVISDYAYNSDDLRYVLRDRAAKFISDNTTTHFPKHYIQDGNGAFQSVFDCMKLCNTFVVHNVKHGSSGERKGYLTNMFLLAERDTKSYTPLILGMVERSRLIEAKTCLINNTPMPTDLLELWIDSSVEDMGSKIKPLYRRHIKTSAENIGLTIKTFPNLSKEVMVDVIPTTKTIEESIARDKSLLGTFYDFSSGKYVSDIIQMPYKSSLMDRMMGDLDEVFAAITG